MFARTSSRPGRLIEAEVLQRLLKLCDFALLGGAALVLSILAVPGAMPAVVTPAAGFFAAELAFLCILAIRGLGFYAVAALRDGARAATYSLCASFLVGGVLFELVNVSILPMGREWLVGWFAFVTAHFTLTRFAVAAWVEPRVAASRFRKRVAIAGGGRAAEEAIRLLEESRSLDIEIVGLFDDRFDERSPESVRAHRKIGRIAELAQFARQARVDLIVVAIPLSAEARLLHILKRLWELPVDIRISGQASALKLSPRAYTYLGKLPLLAVFDRPLRGWSGFLKGAMDRTLAALAIVALAPLMLVVALAIKLESKGPVFFRQKRYGFNNELIEIFKFRSMYTERCDADAARLVTKDDPRVTTVGRFIRKTSIDELPQLFNVLTGELSLVGPRPHATQAKAANALYEQVVDGYFARHKVKPGITGWAQVNGWRGETDTREKLEQRVKHDLEYIDRWSLGFDLLILLRTPFCLFKTQNAY
jgi:Undecaprenyl-phosphate glucose phosphotransferase